MAVSGKTRLETWKEVAAFFGKDERTVKRWEAERGLPIHRLPGEARSRVHAEVAELEAWLKGAAVETADPALPAPPVHASPRSDWFLRAPVLAAAVLIAAVVGYSAAVLPDRIHWRIRADLEPPPIAAQRLYLAGMDDWSRRTPESLHRAVDEFNQAIKLHPDYAEAYVGLANCYNLLREFTQMPDAQAYPLARSAARKALELDDRLASAHVALAFVYANWDWDLPGARREYERAIALDPGSDLNHHWFATFLSSQSETAAAFAQFEMARKLNPTSLAIRSDYGVVLYQAGRRAEGMAMLKAVEQEDPKFLSPHRYLAAIHLLEGDDAAYLQETELAARLVDNRQQMQLLSAARAGRARGGRQAMLEALLGEQLRQYQLGAASAYSVANTYAVLGRQSETFRYLRTAIDRREPDSVFLQADIFFARWRGAPQYRALAAMIRPEAGA